MEDLICLLATVRTLKCSLMVRLVPGLKSAQGQKYQVTHVEHLIEHATLGNIEVA